MKFKSPLSQRIILSFVLLTAVVSGVFSVALTATIDYVEESLSTAELKKDFARVLEDYKKGEDLRLDEGSSFFTAGPTLPDYLRSVATGYTEMVLEDRAFFVYHVREGETSYFLVKDETHFEKAETLLQTAIYGGFALSIMISFVLGLFMAKQVIAPVRKLTRQVADRKNVRDGLPPLSSEYADDEVGALARAFDATITRLQQALQRETLFTSDVSHELRTPLMVINSSCDVLIAKKALDDYTRQRVITIHRAANEIKGLMETFLALARGEDRNFDVSSLAEIVHSEFPTWREMAVKKGNRLILQGESEGAEQRYPSVMLRTVLGNLIRNAIHHTSGGEIVLSLRPEGFDLRDNGLGIAADERAQVFKPYYRGKASHRDGLGLGLSLVQRICEREKWTITLEENEPSGCCFRINFA
jgi:signal transduction histidine kinase